MRSLESLVLKATLALTSLAPGCATDMAATNTQEAHAAINSPEGNITKDPKSAGSETALVKGTIHDQICQEAETAWNTAMDSDPCKLHGVDALGETQNSSMKFIKEIDALFTKYLNQPGTTAKAELSSFDSNDPVNFLVSKVITVNTPEGKILLYYNKDSRSITLYPDNGLRKTLDLVMVGGTYDVQYEELDTTNLNVSKSGPQEPCDGEVKSDYLHLAYGDDFSAPSSLAGSERKFFTYGDESLTCDTPAIVTNACATTGEAIRIQCAGLFDAGELGYRLQTRIPADPSKAEAAFSDLWNTYEELIKKYNLDKLKPANP